jgi:hypothetical protein
MEQLEQCAREYADAHSALVNEVETLNEEVDAVHRAHAPCLRALAGDTASMRGILADAIEASEALFAKPRTRILAGIKVGFRKKKGKVAMRDEVKTIERIKRELPAKQAHLMIRVRESVDRNLVGDLTAADLKRLGIEVTADTDEVVIQPPNAAIAKAAAKLIKDAERDREAA